jgi:transcriptional regulator with XRE-family HTH domain
MPTAGTTLKVERTRAGVTITALAARMGVSRQTLWGIERAGKVSNERTDQYRAALVSLRDDTETAA